MISSSMSKEEVRKLFEEYYIGLVEFSFRISHDEESSRDIVQDVFVKLLEKNILLPETDIQIKTYLFSMVKNATLNHLRRKNMVQNHANSIQPDDFSDSNFLDAIIYSESVNKLRNAIESLPQACREVCKLTYLEGKSNQEAAELTNTSINTVKTQKRRAVMLLKGKLKPAFHSLKTLFLIFF